MKEIPTTPPLPNTPPAQDFSKLGFVYITVLGLANQVVPHTGSWCPLATAINYLIRIAPILYMAFQAQPAYLVGVQLDSGMGRDRKKDIFNKCKLGILIWEFSGFGFLNEELGPMIGHGFWPGEIRS
ncbi:hypothetical protein DSO57_1015554 [Entomophthora muscae]|uniref:Uncharacterized protein n=1 Tax=Entomophthora muscae TaxID=34485 RepID=A0ACC2S788_9FUNG|nr:hypothetical protein DSO57_1015554 [Entomophthora muscae]